MYIDIVKFLAKFDTVDLEDSISNESMTVNGDAEIGILPGNLGYIMKSPGC